jgi:hypothetical protein
MLRKLSTALCILFAIFLGCQKGIDNLASQPPSENKPDTTRPETVDLTGRWFGTYNALENPGGVPDTVSETSLIHDGEASITAIPSNKCLLSGIGFYLPSNKNISDDSCAFTAAVKDSAGVIELDIIGTQNIARVTCINKGDASIVTLSVGKSKATAVVTPAIDFSVYRNTSLIIRGNRALFYVSVHHELSLAFTDADKIGRIKLISAGYNSQPQINSPTNGSLKCSGMRLHNSYSKKLLMKETFSIDGKSNTVFY